MDKLATGLQITVIGMAIVFVILILLNLAMNAMRFLLAQRTREPVAPQVKKDTAPVKQTSAQDGPDSPDDNAQRIAVLTAAVMAAEGGTRAVRIRSLRLLHDSRSFWKQAGKIENIQ